MEEGGQRNEKRTRAILIASLATGLHASNREAPMARYVSILSLFSVNSF